MIINHNISALNTYRQLSSNQTIGQKSLEKLSSGLRINRAGDDAAGLAISEKMRAQIRGLDQASRNAQDGISMIQTAEGALNEVHSILQRMRELANQAANDTNVSIDRDEIQKEINQLTSEINRIGNTTEFNTQKLLNGGGEVKDIAINTMQAGAASGAFKGGAALAPATAVAAETGNIEVVTDKNVNISFGTTAGAQANDITVKFAWVDENAAPAISVTGKEITITLGNGSTATNNNINAIQTALQSYTYTGDLAFLEASKAEINVTGDDLGAIATDVLLAGAKSSNAVSGGVTEVTEGSSSIPITEVTTSVAAKAAQWASGNLTALNNGESGTISFAGVTINITGADDAEEGISDVNQVGANLAIETDVTTTQAAQAQLIVDAFNAVKAEQGSTGSLANFTFAVNGNAIEITGTKEDGAKNNDFALTTTGDVSVAGGGAITATTLGVTEIRGEYSFEIDQAFERAGATINIGGQEFVAVESGAKASEGEFNIGTDKEQQAISLAAAINASSLNTRFDAIVDGGKITLREKEMQATGVAVTNGLVVGPTNNAIQGQYSFNVDQSVAVGGRYSIGGVNIEVTDDVNHAGLSNGTAVLYAEDTTQQASNLANAIAANATLNGKYDVEASSILCKTTPESNTMTSRTNCS